MSQTTQPTLLANDLEPDTGADLDSGVDDCHSVVSSTQSLTDSIREHVYENGRRYHLKSQGKYTLPSDETEQDRLDLTHAFYLEVLDGRLCLAPIGDDPPNVLDCGTGTGIWALDFGEEHPGSHVIGVDLAPIQPDWVASNVEFQLDDLEKDWTFPKNHFDLIHSRTMAYGMKDWQKYVSQMYLHTKPGGFVEISEHGMQGYYCDDDTFPEDSALNRYMKTVAKALEKMGVDPYKSLEDYKKLLTEAGFVDLEVSIFKIPLGTWPKNKKAKRLGAILAEIASTGFEAFGRAVMTKYGGMEDHEVSELIEQCLNSVKEGKEHIYNLGWHIVARKPE